MKLRALMMLLVGIAVFSGSAFGQAIGSITGVIQDATGARIPGVTATATNTATGVKTETVTNESGAYNFPNLAVGPYELETTLPGFRNARVANIDLRNNETLRYNLTMEVGNLNTQVEVSIDARDLLATSSSSIGEVLAQTQVTALPLVGGDVLDLVSTLPGFRVGGGIAGANTDTFAGIASSTINTVRDGLSVTDGRFQNGVFGTTVLNPDMVGEVRLILTPVDAELGRGNGQVQITTRSGTNTFNGAAVWSVRNSALDANTWSNNNDLDFATGRWSPTIPNWQNQHQITLSLGGPIKKNKTFFYGLFDRNIVRTRATVDGTVLTDTARQGIFRYFDGWTPDDADATPGATARPSVDVRGNPLSAAQDPLLYAGKGLICFSVFGNQKVNPDTLQMSPFSQADCPGGTAIFPSNTIGAPYWDAGRQVADTTGFMKNFLSLMPHANRFQGGDGLNTAQIRWTRREVNQGVNSPSAYGGDSNIERKQFNIKVDHTFNQRHKANVGWSSERDWEGSNFSSWPGNPSGLTRRAPWILTSSFTSTLSASMINEARFGVRYNILNEGDPWENPNPEIAKQAQKFFLQGSNGWPAVFNANNGNLLGTGNGSSPINNGDYNGNRTPLYSYGDTLSWTKGTHAYKFGGEIRLTKSIGYNGIPARPIPVLTAGAGANTATNISTNIGLLPGLVNTGTGNAEGVARSLLYFLNGSIGSASQLYWIDSAEDVKNGIWEDYKTLGRKYRDQVQNEFSFFAKDDWKISKSLTLNLGLRWEYYGVPYIGSGFTTTTPGQGIGLFGAGRTGLGGADPFGRWLTPGDLYLSGYGPRGLLECKMGQPSGIVGIPASNCDPSLITGVEFVGPNSSNPNKSVYRNDMNNFGPAIGFAWQLPFGRPGQTTMRGGYQLTYGGAGRNGIQSDSYLGGAPGATSNAAIDFVALGNPYLNLSNVASLVPLKPTNPALPGGTLGGVYSHAGTFVAFDPNYATPYVQNFTLSLTHQLRRNMTIDLRYAGTQGKKLDGSFRPNLINVWRNPELLNALNTVRAGGEAPLFDQLFAGMNLNTGTPGYGSIGTTVNGVVQTGSLHLRRRFATDLAEGDYISIATFVNENTGGSPTSGLLAFNSALSNVGGRILRNGCDRLANGQTTVGPSISTPLRCFAENYLIANPQFGDLSTGGLTDTSPTYNANLGSSNYHSMQAQFTLTPTYGTNLQATYTWSKALELPGSNWADPMNRDADYRLASNHRSHEFRMFGTFQLPLGPGQFLFGNTSGPVARAIEGWRLSWTYNAFSGAPASIEAQPMLYNNTGTANNPHPGATPDVVGPWNLTGGQVHWGENVGAQNLGGTYFGKVGTYRVVPDPQCAPGGILDHTDALGFNLRTGITTCPLNAIADSSGRIVLQNPLPGNRGTLGQRSIIGPGDWTLDGSLSKSIKITESKQLQIRFDAINVLNHPRLTGTVGMTAVAPEYSINDADFGTMATKGDQHRTFQGQLRLNF